MNIRLAGACALAALALACTAAAAQDQPLPSATICVTNACMTTAQVGKPKTVKEAIAAGDPAAARALGATPDELAAALTAYSDNFNSSHGLDRDSAPARMTARRLDTSDGSSLTFSTEEGKDLHLRKVSPDGPGEALPPSTVVTGLDRTAPDGTVTRILLMSDGKIFQ